MSNQSSPTKNNDDSSSFSNPKSWLISQILKPNVSSPQGKDVKKQGILKTALVNSIAFKVAQTISPPKDIQAKENNAVVGVKDSVMKMQNNGTTEADENEKNIARIASKALAEFIMRGKNGHVNQVSTTRDNNNDGSKNVDTPKQPQIDMTSSVKYEINTSGGTLHTLVLNLIERQRDWYIGGIDSSRSKPQTSPNNKTKGEKSMDVTTLDIPLYPQLLKLTTNFIPSPTMFDSLKPLVLWAPFNVLIQPTSTAVVSSLPLTQQLIDGSMKSNLIWVLTDHEWRSWMKDSTSGYIEQSAPSNNNIMNTTSKENVGNI